MGRLVGTRGTIVGALLLLVGTVAGAFALGVVGVPTVAAVDNRFAGVNETTTLVETEVTVNNPNPVGVTLGELRIDYAIRLNDVVIANGSKAGVSVDAGNSTLAFTTAMANDRIPTWWVTHIRRNEHSVMRVEANVTSGLFGQSVEVTPVERSVDTDILSAFNSTETRPVNANSPLVSDPVLYVNETRASWGEVSSATTPIEMAFVVYNPKPAPYTVTKIGYTITMNDVVVGEGTTERTYVIEPRRERTIEATTAIRNDRLDDWWVTHLERDQVTQLRIDFSATVELPGGATIEVPLDALTYTETIETDFFGNENGGTSAPTATPSGTVDGTTASGSAGSDRTDTPDGATAPTATPTPDGGLPIGGTGTGVL